MKIDFSIPASWSSISREHLRIIASLSNEQLTKEEALLVLWCRFAKVKMVTDGTFIDANGHHFRLEPWQVNDFCRRLSWVFDEQPRAIVNPTRVDAYLSDTLFGDYFHADALMYGYSMMGDTKMVRKALRDLGDRRLHVSRLFAEEVCLWWAGVKQWLKEQYPDVFAGGDEPSVEGYDPLKARQNIMLMLNDDKPHDNERIEQSKMHDVLSALQHKIEQAKALEERMKQ